MALAWSVLSVGQGPTSIVHMVFCCSDLSAVEAAGSLLLASLCDGAAAAGSGLLGAVGSGGAGRGGSFSPRAAGTGSVGAAFGIAGDARSLPGTPGGPPLAAHKATLAEPSNARAIAYATKGMTGLRVPFPSPEAVAMRSLSLSLELRLRTLPGTRAAFNGPKANNIDHGRIVGPTDGR
jgi:hypothetical protein